MFYYFLDALFDTIHCFCRHPLHVPMNTPHIKLPRQCDKLAKQFTWAYNFKRRIFAGEHQTAKAVGEWGVKNFVLLSSGKLWPFINSL